jgi:general secretion pathway protein L
MRLPIKVLRWWVARLEELVPDHLMPRRTGSANAVIIAVGEPAGAPARVLMRRRGQEVALGDFIPAVADRPAGQGMVLLRLPSGALLERQLVLPLAAERELQRLIGYEMNRQTPFAADEVFWTCSVVHRDRSQGHLHVRLSLVPKAPLLPLLASLERAGRAPTALEARPSGRPPLLIPLQPAIERARWRRRATIWMAAACGALALVAAALPFVRLSIDLAELAGRIEAARPAVAQVQALRQRIAAAGAARGAIADERVRVGNTLEILADITDLLPDDTFLSDLVLRQRQLTISGQSAAASKLIAALAADPRFRNPAFAAPVVRNSVARTDIFSVRTELAP